MSRVLGFIGVRLRDGSFEAVIEDRGDFDLEFGTFFNFSCRNLEMAERISSMFILIFKLMNGYVGFSFWV